MVKKILLALLVVLIISQFIQPPLNQGNASSNADITHVVAVPDSIITLLKSSCFDCHSDHTEYPWYSRITPVNWWLKNHIDEGKEHLNFTTYQNYSAKQKDHKLEEIAEMVQSGEMPLESYTWIHGETRLDPEQRKAIIDWTSRARQELAAGRSSQ